MIQPQWNHTNTNRWNPASSSSPPLLLISSSLLFSSFLFLFTSLLFSSLLFSSLLSSSRLSSSLLVCPCLSSPLPSSFFSLHSLTKPPPSVSILLPFINLDVPNRNRLLFLNFLPLCLIFVFHTLRHFESTLMLFFRSCADRFDQSERRRFQCESTLRGQVQANHNEKILRARTRI